MGTTPQSGVNYRSYFRAISSAVVNLLPFPWRAGPPSCVLLGKRYDLSIPKENEAFLADFKSRILFTYRNFFQQIEVCLSRGSDEASCSFLQSIGLAPRGVNRFVCDSGWGCMIRVFQMILTELVLSTLHGRDWATVPSRIMEYSTNNEEKNFCRGRRSRSVEITTARASFRKSRSFEVDLVTSKGCGAMTTLRREDTMMRLDAYCDSLANIISMCRDVPDALFSIHNIVKVGEQQLGKQSGEWFGPTSCAQVIAAIINQSRGGLEDSGCLLVQDIQFCAEWCDDGIVDISKIIRHFERPSPAACVILLVTLRLGISSLNMRYQPFLQSCFGLPYFHGLAGGGPLTSAYYFIAANNDNLYFLDPHTMTQPAFVSISAALHPVSMFPVFTVNEQKLSAKEFAASFSASSPKQLPWSSLNPSMTLVFSCRCAEQLSDLLDNLKLIDSEGIIQLESEQLRNAHMTANVPEKDTEGYLML